MSFPEKVKFTLWGIVETMACNLTPFVKNPDKDFTRTRKLGFIRLIRFLLSMESGCINHELLKFFSLNQAEVPTASAFIQQRAKLLPEAFRHLLKQFNLSFVLKKFKEKYFLIAVDGSEFNIARDPSDESTFHPASGKSKKGFNMLHTIALFDLLSKRYLDVVVQPGRQKNEFAAFGNLMDRYSYGGHPVFVADRGFASYNVFAHAMEKGHYFLIRAKDMNTRRLIPSTDLSDELNQWVDIILTRSRAKGKRLHPERDSLYRYICKAVSFDFITESCPEYQMHLRIVRFKIAEGKFENIITNLPDDEFPPDEIKHIYQLRWGIETSFRDLKHTIGTTNFHSKSPEYIEFEILCRMVLYDFCTVITMEVSIEKSTEKWEYQVNLSMAIKICFLFLRGSVGAENINDLIRQYILPIRPERAFVRQLRFQSPASFAYRFV